MSKKTGCLLLPLIMAFGLLGCGAAESAPQSAAASSESFNFSGWRADAPSLRTLTDYVQNVASEDSENFIPIQDRIAVLTLTASCYVNFFRLYRVADVCTSCAGGPRLPRAGGCAAGG